MKDKKRVRYKYRELKREKEQEEKIKRDEQRKTEYETPRIIGLYDSFYLFNI